MISMLILTLVCVAWLEIIGIQSARKEARRREAVERLAGMMDAFMSDSVLLDNKNKIITQKATGKRIFNLGSYSLKRNSLSAVKLGDKEIVPIYEDDLSPIGYRLRVLTMADLNLENSSRFGDSWNSGGGNYYWLIGELYEHWGEKNDVGEPFFALPVCLGQL